MHHAVYKMRKNIYWIKGVFESAVITTGEPAAQLSSACGGADVLIFVADMRHDPTMLVHVLG